MFPSCNLISCKNRADWLRVRGSYIGASDASILIGESPFIGHSPFSLWAEKVSIRAGNEPKEHDVDESLWWGIRLEKIIAEAFANKSGCSISFPEEHSIFVSKLFPWASASLDAVFKDKNGEGPLEIKCIGAIGSDKWEYGPPTGYLCQVQHQMAVTGANHAYIAALLPFPTMHVAWWIIDRDDSTIKAIMSIEKHFQELVDARIQPDIDGSVATSEAISQMSAIFMREQPPGIIALSQNAQEHHEKKTALDAQIKTLTEERDSHLNAIKNELYASGYSCGFVSGANGKMKKYSITKNRRENYLCVSCDCAEQLKNMGISFEVKTGNESTRFNSPRR